MIHVACAADENYAPHCAAMLHSLLSNNPPRDVTVHFLHGPHIDPDVLCKLEQLVEGLASTIDFILIPDEAVEGLQRRGEIAGVMWFRLFLPERLAKLDRILYLDADMLVMDSLQPLWETDLGECYAAAVRNDFEPRLRHRACDLGLRSPEDYFNSGVLLMNLALMRRDHMRARVLDAVRMHGGDLMWQDQDPLNIAFGGRWHQLHPRWNCQNSLFYFSHGNEVFGAATVREACTAPAILHFEGPDPMKPWHFLNKHPYRRQYLEHRARTPWPVVQLEGRTFKNRLLRPLPSLATFALLRAEYRVRSLATRVRRRIGRALRN